MPPLSRLHVLKGSKIFQEVLQYSHFCFTTRIAHQKSHRGNHHPTVILIPCLVAPPDFSALRRSVSMLLLDRLSPPVYSQDLEPELTATRTTPTGKIVATLFASRCSGPHYLRATSFQPPFSPATALSWRFAAINVFIVCDAIESALCLLISYAITGSASLVTLGGENRRPGIFLQRACNELKDDAFYSRILCYELRSFRWSSRTRVKWMAEKTMNLDIPFGGYVVSLGELN